MSLEKPSLLSGFVYGTAALLASWAFSGCRFGNKTSGPIDIDPTGYYLTTPSTLTFSTNVRDGAFAGPTSVIPSDASSVMSNPIILDVRDLSNGQSVIGNTNAAYAIQLFPDDTLWTILSGDQGPLWTDIACTMFKSIEVDGSITRFKVPQTAPGGVQASGRMKAKYTVIQSLQGPCAQTMQDIQNCYQDHNLCQGADEAENVSWHNDVRAYFGPYVESGSITASELNQVRNFSFEAQYD